MNVLRSCERYFTPIGRIILGAFFVMAGLSKIMDISGTTAYIESVGLPMASILVLGSIAVEVGAGGALLVGYKPKYAALMLGLYVLAVNAFFHSPGMWAENPMQQVLFMKNVAIAGGLLFMAAHIGAPCCNPKHAHSHTETPTPTL